MSRRFAVSAPAALFLCLSAMPVAASSSPGDVLRDLGKVGAENYVACRREARYAVDLHPQIQAGGSVPASVMSRVKDCVNRARSLVEKDMRSARAASDPYPRAAGYLRDWHDTYNHALDRLHSDAESPQVSDVSDALREITTLMGRAVDEIHW